MSLTESRVAQIELENPDVVTLDVNMPDMDGLTCLSRIMVERPRPVVDRGPNRAKLWVRSDIQAWANQRGKRAR